MGSFRIPAFRFSITHDSEQAIKEFGPNKYGKVPFVTGSTHLHPMWDSQQVIKGKTYEMEHVNKGLLYTVEVVEVFTTYQWDGLIQGYGPCSARKRTDHITPATHGCMLTVLSIRTS